MKKLFYLALPAIAALMVLSTACAQPTVNSPVQNAGTNVAVNEQKTSEQPVKPDSKPVDTAAISQVSAPSLIKIGDILENHKTYDGKTVIVQGKIATECPSGCWFTLKDGNAVIYIDLAPNNLVIPQKKGADAKVTARVVSEGSDVYLIGSKVEF